MTKRSFQVAALLCGAPLLFVLSLPLDLSRPQNAWTATHWLFTYDFGFVKRGLVGSIFAGVTSEPTFARIQTAQLIVAWGAVAAFLAAIYRIVLKPAGADMFFAAGLSLWLVTLPGVIPQVFLDLGRFDAIGALFLGAGALALRRFPAAKGMLIAFSACALAILVHEAFALWLPPMLLALAIAGARIGKTQVFGALVGLLVLVLLTLVVASSTYSDHVPLEDLTANLQSRTDFVPEHWSIMVHYRDLSEAMAHTAQQSAAKAASILPGGLFLLTMLGFAAWVAQKSGMGSGRFAVCAVLMILPLFLAFVGHDIGRWMSMVSVNAAVFTLFVVSTADRAAFANCRSMSVGLMALGAIQLMLGPMGVTRLFPMPLF